MALATIAGTQVERTDDGFFVNPDLWTE
ncbi:MAG TPA: sulfur relay protein DsrC, partial [Acidimicrobiaceae bacterium]|nr:sulfur relay protein DsrC [Acidimicrobiaceae bacterium]